MKKQILITVEVEGEAQASFLTQYLEQVVAGSQHDDSQTVELLTVELLAIETFDANRRPYPITDEEGDTVGTMVVEAGHDGVWVDARLPDGLPLGSAKLDWFEGKLQVLVWQDPDGDTDENATTVLIEDTNDPKTIEAIRKGRKEVYGG